MTGSASICAEIVTTICTLILSIFWSQLKSLALKLTEKPNFSEINVLLCHITGSALTDPKFKNFVENTKVFQSLKF